MPAIGKLADHWESIERMAREGASQQEVSDAIGIHAVTISKWWKQQTGERWPQRRTGRKRGGRVKWSCVQCGHTEPRTPAHAARTRFCSRDCTNAWQRDQVQQEEVMCACGETFPRYPSSDQQYCTKGCATKHQDRRQRDPLNWITLTCLNPTCPRLKRLFERRLSAQNALPHGNTYCSNACAQRHTKTKHHITLKDDDVLLDSSWEALVWGWAKFLKLPISRVDRTSAVEWRPGCWYAPDFLLDGTWVEVKGLEDGDDPARWQAWEAEHGPVTVLTQDHLRRLIGATNLGETSKETCVYGDHLIRSPP